MKLIKKCILCPFGNKKDFETVLNNLDKQYLTLKNLLPKELVDYIETGLGELKIFNGISIFPSWSGIKEKIDEFANRFKKELKGQIQTVAREWELNRESNQESVK